MGTGIVVGGAEVGTQDTRSGLEGLAEEFPGTGCGVGKSLFPTPVDPC